jgi:hypothetical protein
MYTQDYGLFVDGNTQMAAAHRTCYEFGRGDFSITVCFRTLWPGTLIAKKVSDGVPGWLLVLQDEGKIKFATDDGGGYYQIVTAGTCALDNTWHNLAAIRRGADFEIWLDGDLLPGTSSGNASYRIPLNVSASSRLTVGYTDQQQEPFNRFAGYVDDISLWNKAIDKSELILASHNLLTGNENGLVGLWQLNNTLEDEAEAQNAFTAAQTVFTPVFHADWVKGENDYLYYRVRQDASSTSDDLLEQELNIEVKPGVPYLYGICEDLSGAPCYPEGAQVSVTDPEGRQIGEYVITDSCYVECVNGNPFVFAIGDPLAGIWKIALSAPQSVNFQFIIQTAPTQDVYETLINAHRFSDDLAGNQPYQTLDLIIRYAREKSKRENSALIAAIMLLGFLFIGATLVVAALLDNEREHSEPKSWSLIALLHAELQKKLQYNSDPDNGKRIDFGKTVDRKFIDDTVKCRFALKVDVGGEGYDENPNDKHGFKYALNMNDHFKIWPRDEDGSEGNADFFNENIPYLIYVQEWNNWDKKWGEISDRDKKRYNYTPFYPFAKNTVDEFYMSGAPFMEYHAYEMARCLRSYGSVYLFILDDFEKNVKILANQLKTQYIKEVKDNGFSIFTIDCDTRKIEL